LYFREFLASEVFSAPFACVLFKPETSIKSSPCSQQIFLPQIGDSNFLKSNNRVKVVAAKQPQKGE
jgi:hypothetical protein